MGKHRVIYFIRHGMTQENKSKQYIGWSNPDLLAEEKIRLAQWAHHLAIDEVWSSDLLRAKETAQLLFPGETIHFSSHFREICFGSYEEKTYEELKDDKGYRNWLSNPGKYSPPNGEHLTAFRARVQKGWRLLERSRTESIAVVTHAGWIREWCGLYVSAYPKELLWKIPYGAGLIGHFQKKGGQWQCFSLQEGHLTEKKIGF